MRARKKWNLRRESVTRVREALKVSSDAQVWFRLTQGARITLLACVEDRITGMSNRVAQELTGWGLTTPNAQGHALTSAGVRVRDYGKTEND